MSSKFLKILNLAVPIIGIGLIILYEYCSTSCTYIKGTFWGIDLKVTGVLFMTVALALNISIFERRKILINRVRTVLFAGALGAEAVLVRFQIVNDTYCPFCLAFGACILLLFGANFSKMDKYLALGAFISGLIAFIFFFKGSVLPLYH
jgi:uncharacterized membrane protein